MPTAKVPIIKGDKIPNLETDYRDAIPINMYGVKREMLGSVGYMLSYPGLDSFGTGYGKDRGGVWNERFKKHFRVSGTSLITIGTNGEVEKIGDIPGFKQVAMPYSFNTQCIIADGAMYLYDVDNGLRRVTDSDTGLPLDGVWIDGYYFLTDGDYIYHTELTDESAINPLSYATAEFMPDDSTGVLKTQDNKVVVFGQYSIEPFVNIATADFAFQRVQSRSQDIGIASTHAKCATGGKIYIVGSRKGETTGVYIIGVGTVEKVSTRTIDQIISKYSYGELQDIRVESRLENDVAFVIVHLPEETLCFNETAAATFGKEYGWSILQSDVSTELSYRAINGVFDPRISKWVYGDKFDSRIGVLNNESSDQYGEIVSNVFYTPFMGLETMSIDSIELEIIPGINISTDAKVAISTTQNGIIYGAERWMDYSSQHDYSKRFMLNRIGYCPAWIGMRFRAASSTRMAFSGLTVTYA